MASYPPPKENLDKFNPVVFDVNNVPLTIAEGEKYFVKYPIAQDAETFSTTTTATANITTANITTLTSTTINNSGTIGCNKQTPSYTTLPTYSSGDIGFQITSPSLVYSGILRPAGFAIASYASVPIGIYHIQLAYAISTTTGLYTLNIVKTGVPDVILGVISHTSPVAGQDWYIGSYVIRITAVSTIEIQTNEATTTGWTVFSSTRNQVSLTRIA